MYARTKDPTAHGLGRRSTRSLVAAALCAALVAAAPATAAVPATAQARTVEARAAQARTISDPDTVGDMVTFNADDAAVVAPDRTLNDVRSTRLAHRAHRVTIDVDYVDLRRRAGGDYQRLFIVMRTNEGVRRYVSLDAWRRHWSGETAVFTGRLGPTTCPARHSIDYDADVTRVSVPRRCLSNPRWVTVRIAAVSQGDDGYFADDALSDSPIGSQDETDLIRSHRLFREDAS